MKLGIWLADERGRTQALALALQVSGSLITQWAGGKAVSAERCVPIERATGGAVRRWDLRPDDWHRIWPELIGTEGAPGIPDGSAPPAPAAASPPAPPAEPDLPAGHPPVERRADRRSEAGNAPSAEPHLWPMPADLRVGERRAVEASDAA